MTKAKALVTSSFFLLTSAFWVRPSTCFAVSGPLAGLVSTAAGGPIRGARVAVHEAGRDEVATTDTDGAFSLADIGLPASVDVTAPGFAPLHRVVVASPVTFVLDPAGVTESVVVSADRAPAWRDGTSGATVLGADDLRLLPAVTLDESLRAVSGFSLFRRSSAAYANPTTDGVTMRGLSASGASRGLVLLDGVPLNDGFGGWVTWTRLPTDAVARVDVDRGSAGDAFGSDALGGVIRIVTPTVDAPVASAGVDVGSTSLASLDVSGGLRRGRLSFIGASSAFRTDGSIPAAPEVRGSVDVPTDATWVNGFGRLDVQAGTAATQPDDRGHGRRHLRRGHGRHDTYRPHFRESEQLRPDVLDRVGDACDRDADVDAGRKHRHQPRHRRTRSDFAACLRDGERHLQPRRRNVLGHPPGVRRDQGLDRRRRSRLCGRRLDAFGPGHVRYRRSARVARRAGE
jgi:outer membrane receptor protein involved in Fe transport